MRYHARRRAFLDGWHKLIMAAIIIGGSAAFTGLLGSSSDAPRWAALALTVLATLDLVIGLSHRARDHEMLYRRFSALATGVATTPEPTAENVRRWTADRLRIEADEPPVYRALDIACHNEMIQAYGIDARRLVPLGWRAPLKNFLRFNSSRFPNYEELGKEPPTGPRYPAPAE